MFINGLFLPETTVKITVSGDNNLRKQCEQAIGLNMVGITGFYYGGCGYETFRSVFRTLAVKLTGKVESKLNWYAFDELWDSIFYPEGHLAILCVWQPPNDHIGKHTKELTDLLYALCHQES